jgi:hypothetical protein
VTPLLIYYFYCSTSIIMIIQNKSLPLNLKIRVEVSNERKKKTNK